MKWIEHPNADDSKTYSLTFEAAELLKPTTNPIILAAVARYMQRTEVSQKLCGLAILAQHLEKDSRS